MEGGGLTTCSCLVLESSIGSISTSWDGWTIYLRPVEQLQQDLNGNNKGSGTVCIRLFIEGTQAESRLTSTFITVNNQVWTKTTNSIITRSPTESHHCRICVDFAQICWLQHAARNVSQSVKGQRVANLEAETQHLLSKAYTNCAN